LHGRCADEDGHFGALFHFYVMELFGLFEQESPEQEFVLVVVAQPVVIFQVLRNNGMIKGFLTKK
jgi:hypothetical protein